MLPGSFKYNPDVTMQSYKLLLLGLLNSRVMASNHLHYIMNMHDRKNDAMKCALDDRVADGP
jgi:hypothetical protein